jgi:hypothetical protein
VKNQKKISNRTFSRWNTSFFSPAGLVNGFHPIHISRSAIAALTLPEAPSAIMRVVEMGAPHRLARNAA